jgi:PadR family transcriptional regulator AphA
MSLEHAILGFLDRQPMTGYDLKTRCFDREAAPFWTADQAQVYRTLDRLQRSGLVTSQLIPQPGRPDRKVFAPTPVGRRALREWLETPHPLPTLRDPFLLQIFFSAGMADEAVLAVLDTARDGYQRRLDRLRGQRGRPLVEAVAGDMSSAETALDGAIAQARATIDWIDGCADRVRSRIATSSGVRE